MLHMVLWRLGLSIMIEIAQMPDLTTKTDSDDESQMLIENAGDTDN